MDGMAPARVLLIAVTLASAWSLSAPAASAQTGRNFNVKTMNFDLWCQETQHLPPDRCDKRTAEDEATFEAYRTQIERYEVPYLQQQQRDLSISRDILHNDPVSHPLSQDPQRQDLSPTEQPRITTP